MYITNDYTTECINVRDYNVKTETNIKHLNIYVIMIFHIFHYYDSPSVMASSLQKNKK